jgi:phosphate transport system substrate-binding protein
MLNLPLAFALPTNGDQMEKKTMTMLAVVMVVVVIAAAVGAFVLMGDGDDNKETTSKIVLLKNNSTAPAYSPLDENAVYNKSYPLARYLYLYTDGYPNGSIYSWIDYVLTADKGQAQAVNSGFYALPADVLAAERSKLTTQGTPGSSTSSIQQKGSDTMLEICQLWSSNFKTDESIDVSIAGGGSGTGITALINGDVDVAQASRAMKQSEIDQAIANGIHPVEWRVAVDGIAIIVNSGNPIEVLTMEQLRGIYNGTYTNWNQVGGENGPVLLYGRNQASGTYAYFQEVVLKNENYSASMQQFTGSSQVVVQVEDNPGSVGYVGIGYAPHDPAAQVIMSDENAMMLERRN